PGEGSLPGPSLQPPLNQATPVRRHTGPACPDFLRLVARRPTADLSYTWLRRGLHNGDSRSLRAFLKLAVTPPRRCPGAVPPLPLPVGGAGCGRTLRARQVPPLLQQGNHSSNAHVKGLPVGVQDKVRVFRGLIGVTDAGKVGKLADQGVLVKPFTSRSISVARRAVT